MFAVSSLMRKRPTYVAPQMPVSEAYALMQENRVHQLPIMDGDRLVGIVAERDVREVLDTPLFDIITVEAIMTETPIAVAPDTPAYQAAELLNTYKISALPVVDGDHLVGLVTVNDFLSYFSRHRARRVHAIA